MPTVGLMVTRNGHKSYVGQYWTGSHSKDAHEDAAGLHLKTRSEQCELYLRCLSQL